MNTKTNHEYTSNSYNGGIMGNDSPAALLDMLAEVASQTLHSEKKHSKTLLASQCKTKADFVKRRTNESSFNVPQLLSMPASQLVKQFSIFTSDELKRQYSYTCALVVGCGQKYTSFASEGRARMSIKAHLTEHLEYLKTNTEAYQTFTVKSVSYKNHKAGPQSKRSKLQQSRKPQETLNKENKDVITEKSSNYLRNILLSDPTFKELDKNKNIEKMECTKKLHNSENKDTDKVDFKVLGDHSYFERLKDENPNKKGISLNDTLESATEEDIVLMVVSTDSVHMKQYPCVNKKSSEKAIKKSEAIYFPELSWSVENNDNNTDVVTTKPKGKAKFIGTSKEEREMALAFMDRIKKKGNPTGSNLECRICNPPRSFTAPTTLVSHYRSHAGIKPYECRICRAVFTRRHSLKYHMLIHQNQTRFTCADCGKKFRHPSHFREHRRRHTGEAPFGCDDCGQRFKTRNTYKRHLKTRHGKVLTTTGELLYLSEEDFQKVRTNRKKKNDTIKDYVVDESVLATQAIMHYQDGNSELQNTIDEHYIVNDDVTGSDKNWESNGTIQIVKNCFATHEVCAESHLDKTEPIQTEIPIDDRVSKKAEHCLSDEYVDEVQMETSLLPKGSSNRQKVAEHKSNSTVLKHGNTGPQEIIYHNLNETSSYIQVQYNNLGNVMDDGANIKFQENIKLSKHGIKDHIQIIDNVQENYLNTTLNNFTNEQEIKYVHKLREPKTKLIQVNTHMQEENDYTNKHIVLIQTNEKGNEKNNDISIFKCNSYSEVKAHDIFISENVIGANISAELVNETISTLPHTLMNQNEDCIMEEDKKVSNYQTVITNLIKNEEIKSSNFVHEKNKKSLNQSERAYVQTEFLPSLILPNKCINILPQHFKIYSDQQNKANIQLNKCPKLNLSKNKHVQAINIKQNGSQNTILFLSNNGLQNNIFKIQQHGTENKIEK